MSSNGYVYSNLEAKASCQGSKHDYVWIASDTTKDDHKDWVDNQILVHTVI